MDPETSDDAEQPQSGIVTVWFWQDEPDYETPTMWWLDDLPWPTEEP